jgi:haloalkane dehalogenase
MWNNHDMESLRTPDDRFADLPDFAFEPNYLTIPDGDGGQLRVHYLDEGPADASPVLLMHGEPSWSFLYRFMIPGLVAAGHRVIVPDLPGFGRSDKPSLKEDYTFDRMVQWMSAAMFDVLDLHDITFFGQDWGGLIGLRLVAADPDRYARVAVGNTGLPTGHGTPPKAFTDWQEFAQNSPSFPIGKIVTSMATSKPGPEVVAAYEAPFPDDSYTAGARVLPSLVPTSLQDPESAANIAAWEVLGQFTKPVLTMFSDKDPITNGGEKAFLERVPGCAGQPHTIIQNAGHFLQEDAGPEMAEILNTFIAS